MVFLKLTRSKTKLFLSMIAASFIIGAFFVLINRFLILNFYLDWQISYRQHQLMNFFMSIVRYIAIAYLTLSFYRKKVSPRGKYYTIFQIAALLAVFSFLYRLFLNYINQQLPGAFFSNWTSVGLIAVNLIWYYLLACIIYNFNEIRSERHEK